MILLTGVTGRVGGAALTELSASGEALRVLIRSPEKAARFNAGPADIALGDLRNRDDVRRAMSGIDKALLVTANSEQQGGLERQFADEARRAGVRHLVKISSMEANAAATAPIPRIHYESEQHIKSLGLRWTMLRPNFFMQNLLLYAAAIGNTSSFALPLGDAKTGMVDARDVGAVAARVLTGSSEENASYELTGGEMLSFTEVAARMSSFFGREILYLDQPPEEFRAFLQQIVPSAWQVDAVCRLFAEIAAGALEKLTTSVEELLGRRPGTLDAFLLDYAGRFR